MAARTAPHLVVLAGPNGAGKSTIASDVLRGALAVDHFVNADVIAHGLSAFDPDAAAVLAGRVMLERIAELAARRATFAFETTLASRSLAPFLATQTAVGYRVTIVFISLESAEIAVWRVGERVSRGGHSVPLLTIRRRFERGLRNFFDLYMPLATHWQLLDNSREPGPRLVARGTRNTVDRVNLRLEWARICEMAAHG